MHSTRRIHNDCLPYCAKCVEITETVRLPYLPGTVGTARIFTSGLALNLIIEGQLHTGPHVITDTGIDRCSPGSTERALPLRVPTDDVAPD
ncbi:MAG: hypothetical protein NTW33_01370 [Methanoregula sp.]|nr:hypothetical protein [Methanoregula sp.]